MHIPSPLSLDHPAFITISHKSYQKLAAPRLTSIKLSSKMISLRLFFITLLLFTVAISKCPNPNDCSKNYNICLFKTYATRTTCNKCIAACRVAGQAWKYERCNRMGGELFQIYWGTGGYPSGGQMSGVQRRHRNHKYTGSQCDWYHGLCRKYPGCGKTRQCANCRRICRGGKSWKARQC